MRWMPAHDGHKEVEPGSSCCFEESCCRSRPLVLVASSSSLAGREESLRRNTSGSLPRAAVPAVKLTLEG